MAGTEVAGSTEGEAQTRSAVSNVEIALNAVDNPEAVYGGTNSAGSRLAGGLRHEHAGVMESTRSAPDWDGSVRGDLGLARWSGGAMTNEATPGRNSSGREMVYEVRLRKSGSPWIY